MVSVRRWWCRRFGHWAVEKTRHGLRAAGPNAYRAVAYELTEKSTVCRRCGNVLLSPVVLVEGSIQSLSLPAYRMRVLDAGEDLWR